MGTVTKGGPVDATSERREDEAPEEGQGQGAPDDGQSENADK